MTSSMESHCLPFSEIPHTTKLFKTFVEDFARVARYYAQPPTLAGIVAAARKIDLPVPVRSGVVDVLREQNRAFGAGEDTFRSLDRLANGAVAIVTGQQVGLFTGPAYSLYKAISAARYAEEVSKNGIDAVPVFWLATEDHDLAEVNHVGWNAGGETGLSLFELPETEAESGRRVGEVRLGPGITALVAKAAESLQGGFAEEIGRALRECYTPGETYGSAFGKLMARLVAGRGIIFMDPLDERLHRLSASIYRRALDDADSLRDALQARSKELEQAGYHAQVKVSGGSTLLFYNVDGRREALRSRNGKFYAGNASFTATELRAAIEKTPKDFTPNVLLRPIIQDTLLPTAAYIAGSAEIAYMAQTQVAYEKLLGRMPAILPRASFTIVSPLLARKLGKFGLKLGDVFRGRQLLRSRMEEQYLPRALTRRFDAGEKALRRLLKSYRSPLEKLDQTLIDALDSAESKMLYQFLKLKGKAGRAESVRRGVLGRYEGLMLDALYPHKELQERSLSPLPWVAAYGPDFLDRLSRLISMDAYQHRIVVL